MRDIVMNLNLPQETKDFLLKSKIEEDEFEDINIKFFSKENGFLCDVVEWTKINDHTLKDLNEKFVEEFLRELEKFRDYYVIAENLDSGNLIVMQQGTGEVYELEHEVVEEVVIYFVNSSFSKVYESMNYFKEMKNKVLNLKEEESIDEIEEMFERAAKEFSLIDSKVVVDGDDDNMQFWNGALYIFEEWCFD
ncbi:SUKH-4 family immunity protein [Clostridium beijerinckii]|uniref:SUKH-4 family immunity protein n=1 Tax=Clostridium beijerinckii TaxID=1520 RepID=UPI00080A0F5B|nr:SUKH-4 family immunity protein [Clostridium beijerinckii]OCA98723.1 hypothetical protein BGS1_22840 [Clostridium beijerinckii]